MGREEGKEILNVIRGSDMVLYVIDPFQKSHFKILDDELWKAGMRLNQSPPQVFVSRTRRGGIEVRSTLEQTNMSDEEIKESSEVSNRFRHCYSEDRCH